MHDEQNIQVEMERMRSEGELPASVDGAVTFGGTALRFQVGALERMTCEQAESLFARMLATTVRAQVRLWYDVQADA